MDEPRVPAPGDEQSSRITPGDQIKGERRSLPRRHEDRVRVDVLRRRYATYRSLALRAAVAWAVVATAGCVAMFIASRANTAASRHAAAAALRAEHANEKVNRAYTLLINEQIGECYRINYLRWNDDKERFSGYVRDLTAARFLKRVASTRAGRGLGTVFANAAAQSYFLPFTDCTAAVDHPTTYRPPRAIPFSRVNPRVVARVLRAPPRPPADVH